MAPRELDAQQALELVFCTNNISTDAAEVGTESNAQYDRLSSDRYKNICDDVLRNVLQCYGKTDLLAL